MTQAELIADRTDGRAAAAAWLTTERMAYASIACLGLLARLYGLGLQPLGPDEAAQALPAWQAAHGLSYQLGGTSPLLFTLQRFLFVPLGGSDALARWLPALLGGLSPLLFYALRDRLGRGGALVAALLWALSPLAVFASRLGVGSGLVPTLALALLAALNVAANPDSDRRQSMIWAAISLGALLAAGSGAYTVVLVILVAALVWGRVARTLWAQAAAERRSVLLAGGLSLVLGATAVFTAPAGLAAAVDLLENWVRGLLPGAGVYSSWDIMTRLLISGPFALIFGLGGLGGAVSSRLAARAEEEEGPGGRKSRSEFGLFAGLAAGLALLVSLLAQGRGPTDLALVVLPLTLLAGPAVAWTLDTAWRWRMDLDPWLLVGLSIALFTAAAISVPSYFSAASDTLRSLYLGIGAGAFLLAVALWLVYGFFASWLTVAQAAPVVILLLAGAWGLGQLNGIDYESDPLRQAAVLAVQPGPGWTDFRAELRDLSAANGGGATGGRIDLVVPATQADPLEPVLRWELRDFSALRVTSALPADPAALVITPAELQVPLGDRYSGAGFTLLQAWRPDSLQDLDSQVRWVLYREALTAPATKWAVVLWMTQPKQ